MDPTRSTVNATGPSVGEQATLAVRAALQKLDVEALEQQGVDVQSMLPEGESLEETKTDAECVKPPICDRCHGLIHQNTGNSIYHPSIESLRDTIEESPWKYNHVYHVIDAADFPMSLVPRLHTLMDIELRSQNRRSRPVNYRHGKKMEMSFIISRADLLAPQEKQVNALVPYLKEVLREALGRVGSRVRLGNVHCVSAKNAWWTKPLKELIWQRGGAGWLVGKANVGKSQLFRAIYPRGRIGPEWAQQPIAAIPDEPVDPVDPDDPDASEFYEELHDNPFLADGPDRSARSEIALDENSLLPPPLEATNSPPMPTVSRLPGTTASPIRIPFGDSRGELVDLPGLSRGELERHVQEDRREVLVMRKRIKAEQLPLKPGKSLLLGGFIRITPRNVAPDDELVFLACNFTPIEPHVTSTWKAEKVQTQAEDAPEVENISVPGTGAKIRHAGAFQVRYDVTKARTGPLTNKVAVGLKVEQLPYRVLAIDLLIEGVGWVEVAVQVRTKKLFGSSSSPKSSSSTAEGNDTAGGGETTPSSEWMSKLDLRPEPVNLDKSDPVTNWPVVDVYTPEGKYIGYRRPMNGWVLNTKKPKATKGRPRKSMKGVKKQTKRERRAEKARTREEVKAIKKEVEGKRREMSETK